MRKIALVFMCLLWCATSCLLSEKIDVYILAERGTPEQLQEALENGAEFNVSRATKAEGDEEIATDWCFLTVVKLLCTTQPLTIITLKA